LALRTVLPSKPTDLIALVILFTAGYQREWLFFVPIASMTLLLASYTQTLLVEREQLALFSYGVTKNQLGLVHYVRGLLIATTGILPFQLYAFITVHHFTSVWITLLPTIAISGLFYLLPLAFRLRSPQFVGRLKN
jgi:hypothetical protein